MRTSHRIIITEEDEKEPSTLLLADLFLAADEGLT